MGIALERWTKIVRHSHSWKSIVIPVHFNQNQLNLLSRFEIIWFSYFYEFMFLRKPEYLRRTGTRETTWRILVQRAKPNQCLGESTLCAECSCETVPCDLCGTELRECKGREVMWNRNSESSKSHCSKNLPKKQLST